MFKLGGHNREISLINSRPQVNPFNPVRPSVVFKIKIHQWHSGFLSFNFLMFSTWTNALVSDYTLWNSETLRISWLARFMGCGKQRRLSEIWRKLETNFYPSLLARQSTENAKKAKRPAERWSGVLQGRGQVKCVLCPLATSVLRRSDWYFNKFFFFFF